MAEDRDRSSQRIIELTDLADEDRLTIYLYTEQHWGSVEPKTTHLKGRFLHAIALLSFLITNSKTSSISARKFDVVANYRPEALHSAAQNFFISGPSSK